MVRCVQARLCDQADVVCAGAGCAQPFGGHGAAFQQGRNERPAFGFGVAALGFFGGKAKLSGMFQHAFAFVRESLERVGWLDDGLLVLHFDGADGQQERTF